MNPLHDLLVMLGLFFGAYVTFAAGYFISFTKNDTLNQGLSAAFYIASGCMSMALLWVLVRS